MGIVDYVRLILRTQRGCSFLRVGRMKSSCLFVSFVSTTDEFIRERKHQSDLSLPLPNAGIERLDVGPSEDLALPLPDAGIERQYGCPNLDQNIEELKDKYEKACIRNAALHRHVRGLSSSCALLKRENEILVSKLDRNAKELEEEKISSSDKTKILERENLKNLEKVRTFFQTMLQKRNLKVDQLENTISELNLKMVELEEEHQRDIENVRTRFSHVVRKQNENLVQLESRVADLIQQNCELNSIVDELEDSSYSLPDYYKLLKLDREAPEEEIRSAYRQKMRLIHPDKIKQHRPDADEKFYAKAKKLSIALHRGMEILKNPRLKYQYDIWLDMTNLKQTENLIKQYEAFEERTRCKQYQH